MSSDGGAHGLGDDDWRMRALAERPGFLIRRLHQIHQALFLQECAGVGVTPVQYSVLTALSQHGPTEQATLGRAVGLDATNVGDVISRLCRNGLVARHVCRADKRRKRAALTEAGRAALAAADAGAARAHERTLAALPAERRGPFLRDLLQLVEGNNAESRSPVTAAGGPPAP